MYALEALGDHGPDTQQQHALGRPIARRSGSVFLAGDDQQRHAVLLVFHRELIAQADVGQAPPGSVRGGLESTGNGCLR